MQQRRIVPFKARGGVKKIEVFYTIFTRFLHRNFFRGKGLTLGVKV